MDKNNKTMAAAVSNLACRRLEGERLVASEAGVIREEPLDIYVDGDYLVTASIAPAQEKEFVIGYLFGQGFIEGINDVSSLDIDNGHARAVTRNGGKTPGCAVHAEYRVVSGGGRAAFREGMGFPALAPETRAAPQAVFKAMNTIFTDAALYEATGGVHAAGLFTPAGACIALVEDIGRHNCLDKVIGHALLNRLDCSKALLASTGRMATEMVGKVCRAGIPIAATKTAVTAAALELARRHGLTVIGFVRDSGTSINTDMSVRVIMEAGMKIYTHPERIIGTETL